jgi:glyoxylase-like metal-dependent hydrolase (beta-lactamase superfamily II)
VTGAPAPEVREVAERVFACEQPDGPRLVRQVVIAGADAALVVDTGLPGAPAAGILPLLERLGLPPVVLLTHPDGDHVAGTAELLAVHRGARLLGGTADLPLLGDPERAIRERYARFAKDDDVPFTAAMAERARTRFGAPFPTPEAAPHGLALDLGGRGVTLLATPGHSPGHTAAWVADDGVLAAADAAMGRAIHDRAGNGYIPAMYAPPATYRETVSRLAALPVRTLLTGHEPVMDASGAARFLAESAAACTRLEALTAAALAEGPATLMTLCARVHAAYGGLPDDRVRDLALTVDGHVAELVAAGRAAVEPGPPRVFRTAP